MLHAASKMLLLGHGTIEGKSSSGLSVALSGVRQCLPTVPSRRPQVTPLSQASHWKDDWGTKKPSSLQAWNPEGQWDSGQEDVGQLDP